MILQTQKKNFIYGLSKYPIAIMNILNECALLLLL